MSNNEDIKQMIHNLFRDEFDELEAKNKTYQKELETLKRERETLKRELEEKKRILAELEEELKKLELRRQTV